MNTIFGYKYYFSTVVVLLLLFHFNLQMCFVPNVYHIIKSKTYLTKNIVWETTHISNKKWKVKIKTTTARYYERISCKLHDRIDDVTQNSQSFVNIFKDYEYGHKGAWKFLLSVINKYSYDNMRHEQYEVTSDKRSINKIVQTVTFNDTEEIYKYQYNNHVISEEKRHIVKTYMNLIQTSKYHLDMPAILKHFRHTITEIPILTNADRNILATKTVVLLDKKGLLNNCRDILSLLENVGVEPDVILYSTIMISLIRNEQFEEAYQIFLELTYRSKSAVFPLDKVVYICGIRAISRIRPWEQTLQLLEDALVDLGGGASDVLEVAHTAMINLKYISTNKTTSSSRSSTDNNNDNNNKYKSYFDFNNGNGHSTSTSASASATSDYTQDRLEDILVWLARNNIAYTSKTMDAALAVTAACGSIDSVSSMMGRFLQLRIPPSTFTLNTLLNRCVTDGTIEDAIGIITSMRKYNVTPDVVTYNTLLKLCINKNDIVNAGKIHEAMRRSAIVPCVWTKALLIQMHGRHNQTTAAMSLLLSEPDDTVTSHMLANAAVASSNHKVALLILKRAIKLRKADEAVFIAVAKQCLQCQEFEITYSILDMLIKADPKINKFSLSFLITACLSDNNKSRMIAALHKYFTIITTHSPTLLTNAICQRIIRTLTSYNLNKEACQFHLKYFPTNTCSTETLNKLFQNIQYTLASTSNSNNNNHNQLEYSDRIMLGKLAIRLLFLYLQSSDHRLKKIIRTHHFNNIIRIIAICGFFDILNNVLRIMEFTPRVTETGTETETQWFKGIDNISSSGFRSDDDINANKLSDFFESDSYLSSNIKSSSFVRAASANSILRQRSPPLSLDSPPLSSSQPLSQPPPPSPLPAKPKQWVPSTFTIAELVRIGRLSHSCQLVHRAMEWGLREAVSLPSAVISDSLSMLYGEGHTELVVSLYHELYRKQRLQHWQDREALVMDLHGFGRGMAYAAVTVALKEIATATLPVVTVTGSRRSTSGYHRMLTIITGKNLKDSHSDLSSGNTNRSGRDTDNVASTYTTYLEEGEGEGEVDVGESYDVYLDVDSSHLEDANEGRVGGGAVEYDTPLIGARSRRTTDPSPSPDSRYESSGDDSFRLSAEIQRILVDDFYPPLSSFTAPGNPGRLMVPLPS